MTYTDAFDIDLSEGDLVRVIKPKGEQALEAVRDIGFNDDMERLIGEEKRIRCIDSPGVRGHVLYSLEGSEWVFVREWLELVDQDEPSITDEDFDSIWV